MESIKKKSGIAGGGGSGDGKGPGSSVGNTTSSKLFANAGSGINDVLGKIDLFNKSNKNTNSRGGGQSLGGSKPGRVISVSLNQPGPLGMEVCFLPNN